MSRCPSYVFCPDCKKPHRCIHKPHDAQGEHYWDSRKQEAHTFRWRTTQTKELKLIKSVFLWLAQEEIQVTITALKDRINLYPRVSREWKFLDAVLKKFEEQVRSPEVLALAKKVLQRLKHRKNTPLARKRWATKLAKSMMKAGEAEGWR